MLCVAILFPFLMSSAMQTVDASHGGVVLGVLPIATALVAVAITHVVATVAISTRTRDRQAPVAQG